MSKLDPRPQISTPTPTSIPALSISPHIGDQYKSYRDMCNQLQLPIKTGNAKVAQMAGLSRYFKWDRIGNGYVVTEVYDQPKELIERRGKKDLTTYENLCHTVLLYLFKYEDRDPTDPTCLTVTRSDLKQKYFKLINKDYYNIRKDGRKALLMDGVSAGVLSFADNKITSKSSQLIDVTLDRLEKEGLVYISNRYYIYYINAVEYQMNGDTTLRVREATHSETVMITSAKRKSNVDLEESYVNDPALEKKFGLEKYEYLKKKMLDILNGVEHLDDIKKGDLDAVDLVMQGIDEGEGTVEGDWKVKMHGVEGLKYYALKKGEIWVNIVDKIQIFPASDDQIEKAITQDQKNYFTMPGAQEALNDFMINWLQEKAGGSWTDFSHKFLNEAKSGSQDLSGDINKIIDKYVSIRRAEIEYQWREYKDEDGNIWKIRWSNTPALFHEGNMEGQTFRKNGKRFVLWNVPRIGWMCSNDEKLLEEIEAVGVEKGWLPIKGFLGGVMVGEEEEGCYVLILDAEKVMELKDKTGGHDHDK